MPKHAKVKLYEKYNSDGTFEGERCPRCGGILAKHKNRRTCGRCGYSAIDKVAARPFKKDKEQKESTEQEETPKEEIREVKAEETSKEKIEEIKKEKTEEQKEN